MKRGAAIEPTRHVEYKVAKNLIFRRTPAIKSNLSRPQDLSQPGEQG